jgi:hypothetical protein
VFSIDRQAINASLQAYYKVECPNDAPDSAIRVVFAVLLPKGG